MCCDYVPVTFLLACHRPKNFEGGSADETFNDILEALNSYLPSNDFVKKLVCLVADGASVNFGVT